MPIYSPNGITETESEELFLSKGGAYNGKICKCHEFYTCGPASERCRCPEGKCWYKAQQKNKRLGLKLQAFDVWLSEVTSEVEYFLG